jgi:hypothetical protein
MCGICGVARHPDGPKIGLAKEIVLELLFQNERRGRHATGVAVQNGSSDPQIFKKAIEASKFIKGDPFLRFWDNAAANGPTKIILGHTRHATHQNAHEDNAAHPFRVGSVVGAHNGIIRNWRELEDKYVKEVVKDRQAMPEKWVNDSQAAFGMLDLFKDPVTATDELDGYFALSWIKDEKLFLCRAQSPELAAAYVPSLRALFWSSELQVLRQALMKFDLKADEFDIWGLKPGTIYRYDPSKFDDKGANGTKKDAPFRGISSGNRTTIVNGANPTQIISTQTSVGGYSTQRSFPGTGRKWNATTATEEPDDTQLELTNLGRKRSLGARNAETEMDRVWDAIALMNRKIQKQDGLIAGLEGTVESLRAEIEYLYELLNEEKPELFEVANEAAVESPYKEAPCCGEPEATCRECKKTDTIGNMLVVPGELREDGRPTRQYVHPACVMQDVNA